VTIKDFLDGIQKYYGMTYQDGQKPYIAQYLETFNERALSHLFAKTLTSYSGRYKALPDIAVWEGLRQDIKKLMETEQLEADHSRLAIEDKSEYASPEQVEALVDHFKKTIFRKGEFSHG
jgi:hypothetical protein